MKLLMIVIFMMLFTTLSMDQSVADEDKKPEILTIHPDGTMVFRNRTMNEDEVIIYPDGRGGEKAAVRVYEPIRPLSRKRSYYYRDTIVVDRIDPEKEQ